VLLLLASSQVQLLSVRSGYIISMHLFATSARQLCGTAGKAGKLPISASLMLRPNAVSLLHACTAGSTHCQQLTL
jgi:hypothetical protein